MQENFYAVLEVDVDASPRQIERAYRIARSTYQPGSAATYSVFNDEENGEILRRIDEAYSVLSEARLRRDYDARLRREGALEPEAPPPEQVAPRVLGEDDVPEAPPGVQHRVATERRAEPSPAPRRRASDLELELDEPVEPEDGVYDGAALRRARMSRGIELDEISATTKISELHLQRIEGNRYEQLPAPVYLRGFLKQIASILRLDASTVAESYLGRMKTGRGRD